MTKRLQCKVDDEGRIEWDGRPTYTEIVETFGEIVVEATEEDYQGDSLFLIRQADSSEWNGFRYGVLTFGWGSCSGCDSLQAVDTQEDVDSLQDDLERGIQWFGGEISGVVDYFVSGGMKDSYLRGDLVLDFFAKVKAAV